MIQKLTLIACLFVVAQAIPLEPKGVARVLGVLSGRNSSCKGEPFNLKDIFKGKIECVKELYPEENISKAQLASTDRETLIKKFKAVRVNACVDVCQLKKQGILDAQGMYISEAAGTFVKSEFPEIVHQDLKQAFDECAAESSSEFSMEDQCTGYKKFRTCYKQKIFQICEIDIEHHLHEGEAD